MTDAKPAAIASAESKPASAVTRRANNALRSILPFNDSRDFENAKRGLIAKLPNKGVVKDSDGNVVWDLDAFRAFIKDEAAAPKTANPSLWRQAQLLMHSGLFEVVEGVYQVRGADLSNMTIVEGDKGIIIVDPLISKETARYALALYRAERGKKPVTAVIYTHSHIDHFGGVRGIVDEEAVDAGEVPIFAPSGFLDDAIEENVYAGTAMGRRASYMYGNLLPKGPMGQMTAGLGITTSSGETTVIAPTHLIEKTGERHTIDGIEHVFVMAPGSEAPSEMMWYMPKFKMLNMAEDSTHNMHNLYTLRGAKTRDAQKWPGYLNEVLKTYGGEVEVEIAQHHWPTWGNEEVVDHIKAQRDIYKYLHDQTLHFANMGYTMNELPDLVEIPQSLIEQWSTHGYYGSQSHNVRAVYNFYLGYFDGNPAHLDPLPPVEVGLKYVTAMGGAARVLEIGTEAIAQGEYRWAAELINHLVFAQPDNQEARSLQADALEQMGYQAESGPWRNFYLAGASELRNGVMELPTPNTTSPDIIANMSLKLVFGYMGVQLNAKRAEGKTLAINFNLPDIKEKHTLFLENSVLNHWSDYSEPTADATVTLDRATLNKILAGQSDVDTEIENGTVQVDGSREELGELLGSLDDLGSNFWFNIVTP